MGKSRTEYAAKNFLASTASIAVNGLFTFITRTVFIYKLGELYLGVNGLFSNLLGILSLAELGVGSAISFCLYKPLAESNEKKIQAIMHFYKSAYRIIALVVSAIGIGFIPLLGFLVKEAEGVENLLLIYAIFMFNTVSTYLISYKSILLSADQKNYLLTNINMVIKALVAIVQVLVLLFFENYVAYLISDVVVQTLGKVFINVFVNSQYPFLTEKNNQRLEKSEKRVIFKKVKALILHKIGDVSINQTDNLITSAVINITTVGLVSNFVMIINLVNSVVTSFFGSATAGLGNLIVTESCEKRYQIAKNYDFLGFIFYGWSAIVLFFCLTPFVRIWLGDNLLIDPGTIMLLCINYYLTGARVPISNVKIAAGLFEEDRWVPLVQSGINIVVSIVGAKHFGLRGIYLGTMVSSMIPNVFRPIVTYKIVFHKSCGEYFMRYFWRIFFLLGNVFIVTVILFYVNFENPYFQLVTVFMISSIIPAISMYAISRKTDEFAYVKTLVQSALKRLKGNKYEK